MFVSHTVFADVKKPDSVTISYIEHIPPNWFRDSEGTLQGIGPDY